MIPEDTPESKREGVLYSVIGGEFIIFFYSFCMALAHNKFLLAIAYALVMIFLISLTIGIHKALTTPPDNKEIYE